jgi:MFS family permease
MTSTAEGRADRLLSPALRASTIGTVALISLFAFEALAVSTAMPVAAADLGGVQLYALAFGAPLAAGVVGMVAAGPWSDRRGPGPATAWGLGTFVVGLVLAGLAPSMEVVVAGRTLQGVGSGAAIVALYVLVARTYPEELHPRIFAAFSTAWVVPSLVGPPVAGLVAEHLGWRWVFLAVPFGVVPALLLLHGTMRRLTDREAPRTGARAPLGWAALAALSAGTLHVAGQRADVLGVLLLVVSLLGLVLALPRLVPTGTFRARRGLPTVIALRGLFAAGFFSAEVFIPPMLNLERGWSPSLAGAALTVGAVTWAIGSNLQARLSTAANRPTLLRVGALLVAAAVLCAAVTAALPVPTATLVVGWALAGTGMGIAYPTLSMLALQLAEPGRQGQASSALQISDSIASSVALAVSGTVFAALLRHSPDSAYVPGFLVAAVIALVAAAVAPRVRT